MKSRAEGIYRDLMSRIGRVVPARPVRQSCGGWIEKGRRKERSRTKREREGGREREKRGRGSTEDLRVPERAREKSKNVYSARTRALARRRIICSVVIAIHRSLSDLFVALARSREREARFIESHNRKIFARQC